MAVHVRPVALGIERADRVVLVEVVGRHVPKRERARPVPFDQVGIDLLGRRTGRQAQDRPAATRLRGLDRFLEQRGSREGGDVGVRDDENFHPGIVDGLVRTSVRESSIALSDLGDGRGLGC